jgi:hypothetical protein
MKTPWQVTKEHKRDYLTPEDVTESQKSGCDKITIWREVLQAVERRSIEDACMTAFVALDLEPRAIR